MSTAILQVVAPMVGARAEVLARVAAAWREAGMACRIDGEREVKVSVARRFRARAMAVASEELRRTGWRVCVDRANRGRLFGFHREGALRIDFGGRGAWVGLRQAPCVALVGPDGVGKSTVLDIAESWFAREAPFVEIARRKWRPMLLPSLARVAGREEGDGSEPPRRKPGNLHWLRVGYYFADFLLGGRLKDREARGRTRLVVYDRCALDMSIDPYRYALGSARGTELLWRFCPRPRTVILLTDDPARIYRRKRDLEEQDMREQLAAWHRLAAEGRVDAVVTVNGGAEEVAARVWDVMVDGFIRANCAAPAAGGEGRLRNVEEALCFGGAGDARFAVAPTRSNPRYLIPLESARVAARSLDLYNAQRPLARAARRLLSAGLRAGIARPLLRGRVSLAVPESLRRAGVSLGTAGPDQKPVLQLMDAAGGIRGYAKVGWNERTIELVRNEEAALRRLAGRRFSTADVPVVLDSERRNGRYVVVQSAVRGELRSSPAEPDARHIQFLVELGSGHRALAGLPLPRRVERGGFEYYGHLLELSRAYCGPRGLAPSGPIHGDFAPWNIRVSGDRLLVFDWEYAREVAPCGWDLIHFLISTGVEIDGLEATGVYRKLLGYRVMVERVGVEPEMFAPVLVSYLADALSSSIALHGANVGAQDAALRRVWAGLLAILIPPAGVRR